MGGLFGKPADAKVDKASPKDQAILELKVQRDRLKKYQKKIDKIVEAETAAARKLLAEGKRKQASLCLKKKKYQETQLDKVDGMLMNLEEMVNTIEFASIEAEVIQTLKTGKDMLQTLNEQMSLEDVENLMLDTEEAVAYQNELAELMGSKLSSQEEEDILKELDELEALENEETTEQFPAVPTGDLPKVDNPEKEPQQATAKQKREQKAQALPA